MTQNNPQVPWTDEQWARVTQVIREESSRARVAATFLPLVGPLPPDTDFVRADVIDYADSEGKPPKRLTIDDTRTIKLPTLQVKVFLRGAQMADPELASALSIFRRAANVLARLEDAVVFNGQVDTNQGPKEGTVGLPPIWQILGGQPSRGLLQEYSSESQKGKRQADGADRRGWHEEFGSTKKNLGETLVARTSTAIGELEAHGHFGPFALVLGQELFTGVQSPNESSLVLPQDRIIPFLGGGPLLRSSTLPPRSGAVVALGGAPVELVVATDVSLNFLQVTTDPMFAFRVYEKMVLRIKEEKAIAALYWTGKE